MPNVAHKFCFLSCFAFHKCTPRKACFYRLTNSNAILLARRGGSTFPWSSIRAVGSSQARHHGGHSAGQGESNARRRRRLDDILIVVEGINDMRAVKRAIDVDVRFDCQLL